MKTILITGASSGIGMEYAKRFAELGNNLVLVARREDILLSLSEELHKKYSVNCYVIPMDLSEIGAARRVYDQVEDKGIQVDILINNAGFATKGLLEKIDSDKQHQEIQVNVVALVELTQLFIAKMAVKKDSLIINVGSAASFNPIPYNSVYAATKAFVLSFTQSIAYEYKDKGVKVMAVCPQATDTHFFDNFNKMSGKMRTAKDVVDTTFAAMKRGKIIAADGSLSKLQSKMHHFLTRKARVNITGRVAKPIWGRD